jgi:hypothetical protein
MALMDSADIPKVSVAKIPAEADGPDQSMLRLIDLVRYKNDPVAGLFAGSNGRHPIVWRWRLRCSAVMRASCRTRQKPTRARRPCAFPPRHLLRHGGRWGGREATALKATMEDGCDTQW